jgi:hypothetical protein
MQIFEQEILDGLSEQLTAKASVSYASFAEPYVNHSPIVFKDNKALAAYNDSDLYYVQSILVSSSWNKNDDIFDKAEVWKAKHTPEHKPTNLEHNEDIIIGHIISNWPITDDGIIIPDDTKIEDLPNKYHIVTGSVIYTGFTSSELRDRALKLIAEIENGTKYVSMECFFKGFDYGVLNAKTNEYKVLARNDETAYLTKFLRAYGGMGQHEDYKIGRVLRNITFTGKGFVDRPANSDSIIFTKNIFSEINQNKNTEKSIEIVQTGVSNSQSNINSETITMSSANEEVQTQPVEAQETTVETIVEAVAEPTVDTTALASEVAELKLINEKLESEITLVKEEAAKKMEVMEEEKKKMKAELEAVEEVLAAYKTKEAEMVKKEKMMKRKASLTSQGIDEETAASVVEKFESMEDSAFEAITTVFAAMKKKTAVKEDKEEVKAEITPDAQQDTPVDASVLETAEVENEVNLSVGGEVETEIDSTRAALVDFVRSKIGKKVK